MSINEVLGIDPDMLKEDEILEQMNGQRLNSYINYELKGDVKAKAKHLLDSSLVSLNNEKTILRVKIKSATIIFLLSLRVKISFFDTEDFEELVNHAMEEYENGGGKFHEVVLKLLKEKYGN